MLRNALIAAVTVALLACASAARAQAEPVSTTDLLESSTDSLSLRLTPMPAAELEALIEPAMEELQRSAFGLAEMLRVKLESKDESGAVTPQPELDEQITAARTQHSSLIARIKLLLTAAEAKGLEVAAQRQYLQEVSGLGRDAISSPPVEEKEDTLSERIDNLVAEVQAMPPVHERPEPWKVSVEELRLELQPLQAERIEERVKEWLIILERETRKRIRIDIALERLQSNDPEFTGQVETSDRTAVMQQLAARSQEQQVIIEQLVERISVPLNMLKAQNVDVSAYRAYVSRATGQRLNLMNPAVLWSQIVSWAVSPTGGIKVAVNIGKFIGVLFVFWVLSRIVGRAVSAATSRMNRTSSLLKDFLVKGASRVVLVIGFVAAVSAAGINMGWALAIIGAAGLVIGLALQGTLSNFASGLLILFYRPFDVGNVVTAGGVNGKVEKLRLFTTTFLTFDNQVMHVPNNEIWGNVITNATDRTTRRVDLVFGIGYGDNIAKAQSVLEDVLSKHDKVLSTPEPTIKVNELGDNSVNFIVRPWVKTPDYWDVYWDLHRQIKERFDEEGINIPFPQRDLHLPDGPIEIKLSGQALDAASFSETKDSKRKSNV